MASRFKASAASITFLAGLFDRDGPELNNGALRSLSALADQCIGSEASCYALIPAFRAAIQKAGASEAMSASPQLKLLDRNTRYVEMYRDYRPLTRWERPIADHPVRVAAVLAFSLMTTVALTWFVWRSQRRHAARVSRISGIADEKVSRVEEERDRVLEEQARISAQALEEAKRRSLAEMEDERRKHDANLAERSLAAEVLAAKNALAQFAPKPTPMNRPDIRVASAFSEASTVSGDFFNWSIRSDGSACVYLVDVEGHGFEAASQAILSATILSRTILGAQTMNPREAMELADKTIRAELGEKGIAVTMSLIQVSPDRRRLALANAGMPPTLLFRFGQSAPEIVQAAGAYVGAGYERWRALPPFVDTTINAGDLIVAYSDGLTEARDKHGALFDVSGIAAVVAKERHRAPSDIAHAIIRGVKEHSGIETPDDDQMVVVVQIGAESSEYRTRGAPTLELVGEGEYALINAADSVAVCDCGLYPHVAEWAASVDAEDVRPAWNAVWEAVLNALIHGSGPGDVITIRFAKRDGSCRVEIEQPREWRDWDRFLRTNPSEPLQNEHLGTTTIRNLSEEVVVSKQGRCIALVFARKGERAHGTA